MARPVTDRTAAKPVVEKPERANAEGENAEGAEAKGGREGAEKSEEEPEGEKAEGESAEGESAERENAEGAEGKTGREGAEKSEKKKGAQTPETKPEPAWVPPGADDAAWTPEGIRAMPLPANPQERAALAASVREIEQQARANVHRINEETAGLRQTIREAEKAIGAKAAARSVVTQRIAWIAEYARMLG